MPLHRFVTPSYFGGLPGTHDLINVVSGGVGAGGSALADAQKSGGPNDGTYFVAFGDNATSNNANRGFRALAENTDFLDDIVHIDQSVPTVSALQTAVGVVSSAVLTGEIFVAGGLSPDTQRVRNGLVMVQDADGYPLLVLSGGVYVPVLVTNIHDGIGNSVISQGYYTDPTLDFSPSIPNTQTYRLDYYLRSNLKSQPRNTYSRLPNGLTNLPEIWGYAKTTKEGDATFTGDKIFSDPVDFQGTVELSDTVEFSGTVISGMEFLLGDNGSTPRLLSNEADSNDHVLIWESDVNTDGRAYRLYTRGNTTFAATMGGIITVNASWNPGTNLWVADNAAVPAFRWVFGITGLIHQERTTTAAPWADGVWGEVRSSQLRPYGLLSNSTVATEPLLETTKSGVDDTPASTFKLIGRFKVSATNYARLYVSSTNTGQFIVTINAEWDQSTTLWTADDAAAQKIKAVFGLDDFFLQHRGAGGGSTWNNSSWSGTGGDIVANGRFRYLSAKTRTKLINIAKGVTITHATNGVAWRFINGPSRWVSELANLYVFFPVELPHRAILTDVRALVKNGDGTGSVTVGLAKVVGHDFTGEALGTESTVDTDSSVGNNVVETVAITGLSEQMDNDVTEYWAYIVSSANGDTVEDALYAIELTYTEEELTTR